jgi:uncharacterized protein with HEPN domain
MRRDDQRLNDILEALDWIAKAVAGRTEADFLADDTLLCDHSTAYDCWRGGGPAECGSQGRDPSVPWQDIMGLRNILVHEYFGIYWPLVWQTAVDHAPVLRDRIAAIRSD